MNLKKAVLNWRVIFLVILLFFSVVAIQWQFNVEGVSISNVAANSSAANAGMAGPSAKLSPVARERILSIDRAKINSVDEYYAALSGLEKDDTVRVETSSQIYNLLVHEQGEIGVGVREAPKSNLRKGLDLAGGIRVLLEPQGEVSDEDIETITDSLQQRLNVFGLSDVIVRAAQDLAGKTFILIEIAGVTEDEVKKLLSGQGKFEATVANQTVFFGGDKDITYVCRSAECSGIDPQRGCYQLGEGWACNFFFSVSLSGEAAARQAEITSELDVIREQGGSYLSEDIVLYLDDIEVDRLRIGSELKGRETTQIQISGSGQGRTQEEALANTLADMKTMQTIIITGSLPVKLDIVKLDTISPSLGEEFLKNVIFVGMLAILVVIVVVYIRYRKIAVVLPMVLTLVSEMVLILGFAAFVGWNLDLAGIAGLIIVVGTGVDHLIVITDETVRGEVVRDWKKKIKGAMFIVMGAYLTTLVGMMPLLWAGAGLLKGFALTTIAGISFGVLVARPAYAAVIEHLIE